jgi:uncharacterized membrane protein
LHGPVVVLLGILLLFDHVLPVFLQPFLEIGLLDVPVIHEVKLKALSNKGLSEHRNQLLVVRFLLKSKLARIVKEVLKFLGVASAEVLNAGDGLFDFDLLVLFFLSLGWQTLPWERPSNEVHQNHCDLLNIISS